MEGNSAAHLKASAIGSSATLIVENGELLLGTWQGIYFCETYTPVSRRCAIPHKTVLYQHFRHFTVA
jgi:secondary thiamine-phosphate synthase enzyme